MLSTKLKLRGNFDYNKLESFFDYLKKLYPDQDLSIHWSDIFIKNTNKSKAVCVKIKKNNKTIFAFRGSHNHDTGWIKLSEIEDFHEEILSELLNLKLIEAPRKLIWSLCLCFLFVFALATILTNDLYLTLAQKYIPQKFIGSYILIFTSIIFTGLYTLKNTLACCNKIKLGKMLVNFGFVLLLPISFLIYPIYSFLLERLSYYKALKYIESKEYNNYSCKTNMH